MDKYLIRPLGTLWALYRNDNILGVYDTNNSAQEVMSYLKGEQ